MSEFNHMFNPEQETINEKAIQANVDWEWKQRLDGQDRANKYRLAEYKKKRVAYEVSVFKSQLPSAYAWAMNNSGL